MNKEKDCIGVILAAGFSSRAKTFKMTLDFKGVTVIESTILKMSLFCSKIIVVGGYQIENLNFLKNKYPFVDLIFNENYEEGMYSSVKKGFFHAIENKDTWNKIIFTPGDYPAVDISVYKELFDASNHENSGDIIIPAHQLEDSITHKTFLKNGHPIIIKKELLLNNDLSNYNNLREFLYNKEQTFITVGDKAILKDLDTIEDYKELLKMINKDN